ncbi:MAG: hypothetical protein H7338_22630 [Candidatus Sericytochromatia bacterium]|nr:hypothetical protein [Candidatus Sericytochromatia bacterium]
MHKFPKDLAQVVIEKLPMKSIKGLTLPVLTSLLETVFFASLSTEEAQQILCSLTYINPDLPDPDPPKRVPADRWGLVRFRRHIPLTVASLVKLSKAAAQSSSNLAVYHDDKGRLFVWGMLDQTSRYADYLNLETTIGADVPGYFNVVINSVGNLSVYRDYTLIGGIKHNQIISRGFNVLQFGPIGKLIRKSVEAYVEGVKSAVGTAAYAPVDHWNESLSWYWLSSLRRVLINIQAYRNGGSLLLIPPGPVQYQRQLDIKYKIEYPRLPIALHGLATAAILRHHAEVRIADEYIARDKRTMPVHLFQESSRETIDEEHHAAEITGCIRFIASLSRSDGLVLTDFGLNVLGFGVEIKSHEAIESIFIAGDIAGTPKNLQKTDYKQFGTRHRSMMRFCRRNPGSLGFVVSQDGDIRAMTRVGERLIIWENIEIQLG